MIVKWRVPGSLGWISKTWSTCSLNCLLDVNYLELLSIVLLWEVLFSWLCHLLIYLIRDGFFTRIMITTCVAFVIIMHMFTTISFPRLFLIVTQGQPTGWALYCNLMLLLFFSWGYCEARYVLFLPLYLSLELIPSKIGTGISTLSCLPESEIWTPFSISFQLKDTLL